MKNKKDADTNNKLIALIILIILFVTCFTIGVVGSFFKIKGILNKDSSSQTTQTNKSELFYDGILHFPNNTQYKCNGNYCNWAYEMIDDINYSLKFYNDNKIDQLNYLINNRFAFIIDANQNSEDDPYHRQDSIKVYDTTSNQVIAEYTAVKNYTQELYNNIFIVQDKNGKWGVINFNDDKLNNVIDFKYDYIGVFSSDDNLKEVDKLVIKENDSWNIIDFNNNKIMSDNSKAIIGYDNNLIAYQEESGISISNKNGQSITNENAKDVLFTTKDAIVYYTDTSLNIISTTTEQNIFTKTYSSISNVQITNNDNEYSVEVNGNKDYTF